MNITTKIKNNKFIKTLTLVSLGILFAVGAVYVQAFFWQGPTKMPPECNPGEGCDIPINDTSANQSKVGKLGVQTSFLPTTETLLIGNQLATDELLVWGDSALSISGGQTIIGDAATGKYGGLIVNGSTAIKQLKTTTGGIAGVCADVDAGKLVQCATPPPPPGTPVVTLTLNGVAGPQSSTYVAAPNSDSPILLSQPVTVAWTTMNMGGGTCTASGSGGWNGTKGSTGGSESFSITKFGENIFNISCIKNGVSKTATATLTMLGTRTYSSPSSTDFDFTVPQTITSSAPYTVKVWGAGGGGGGNGMSGSSNHCGGGGGGAGEYRSTTLTMTSGTFTNDAIHVGAGGTAGANGVGGTNGTNGTSGQLGQNSTFGSYVTAKGGAGGNNGQGNADGGAGGAGGTGGYGGAPTAGAAGQNGSCNTVSGTGGPGGIANNGAGAGGKGGGFTTPVAGSNGRIEVSW